MPDRPPPDITMAVSDGSRRLTYAELADIRGISRAIAERLTRRRRWPRQMGNDGVTRVIIPLSEAAPAVRDEPIYLAHCDCEACMGARPWSLWAVPTFIAIYFFVVFVYYAVDLWLASG